MIHFIKPITGTLDCCPLAGRIGHVAATASEREMHSAPAYREASVFLTPVG